MRTTLDIESDVPDPARKGDRRNGFSIFPVADPHATFGHEDVRAALDAEDLARARDFLNPLSPC